jgi:iron complex outermembrane receptor protein
VEPEIFFGEKTMTLSKLLVTALSVALTIPFVLPVMAEETDGRSVIEEIVVTAQKREESINEVGMSIQATSGDRLDELGITDTAELFKVVSGFNSNVTYYGTTIYTIRGVGFQDTALASSPTVSVYLDEMPLPYSVLTQGVTLDLQRVEVLKGPQGTLFGQNATGGAVNYVANKPTEEFEAGIVGSYGKYNTFDLQGFLSGPITESLKYRVAARRIQSDGWQEMYTNPSQMAADPYWTDLAPTAPSRNYAIDDEAGDQDFVSWRASLLFEPNDRFSALLTTTGFIDEGDSQRPQLHGFATLNPINGLDPLIANYPLAPRDNESADWGACVNVSGGTEADVYGFRPSPGAYTITQTDPGGESLNLANRRYDRCEDATKDNDYWSVALRMDIDITDDIMLTSLTSVSDFNRDQKLESDGTIYQDYESYQTGYIEDMFQEFRLSGSFKGNGNWVVGANWEKTDTWDSFLQTYGISTAVPTQVFNRIPLGPTNPNSKQEIETWAVFTNAEYELTDALTLQAGVRYSEQTRDHRGCGSDGGDGTWADISVEIQQLLQWIDQGTPLTAGGSPDLSGTTFLDAGPGNCATTGPAPTYAPVPSGFTGELDENSTSWRVGANWFVDERKLVYANISKGFKSGSFPTVATAAAIQLQPATQEELLAYEIGIKMSLLEGTLQLNAAAFYYDYTDKQVLGAINDPIFGSLPSLVNVPESEVIGAEFSAEWYPTEGLRIAPSLSYADSEVKGQFRNFDPFFSGTFNPGDKDFSGQSFPNAPRLTGNMDVQYEWRLDNGMIPFVGVNANYQSDTRSFFYDRCQEANRTCTPEVHPFLVGNHEMKINARTLVDLRAGVEAADGRWRVWAWSRNVTDKYYWNQSVHVNDVLLKYTGMPRTYGLAVNVKFGG